MSFKTALRARVKNDPTIDALIGKKDGAPAIDWRVRPQGFPYPSVVLQLILGDRTQNMGGYDSTYQTTVDFVCSARSQPEAEALRDAVEAAVVPEATVGGIEFQRGQNITYIDGETNTDAGTVFREHVQITFRHS